MKINDCFNRYLYTMTKFYFLFLIFLSFSFTSFAQTDPTYKDYKKEREGERKVAEKNILLMKEGVLLVRLDFKSKEVAYYEKYNNTKAANKLKKKQIEVNQYIIEAFDSLFNFCPVYFFGEKDSRNILEGRMNEVIFDNLNCEPDTSVKWKNESFFIAEFGRIEGDTTLEESSKLSAAALIIRDNKFKQLRDPFPYFSIYHEWGIKKKKFRMSARRMNESLDIFYKRMKGIKKEL